MLGRHLGAGRASYAEVEADGAHFVVHPDYIDGVPSFAGRYLFDSFGPGFVADLRAGRTVAVTDAERDAQLGEAERAAYAAGAVRAAVAVPLVKGGRLAAVLFLHFPAPHAWPADEVALVEETAERTWAAVERARAEAALRVNERRARIQSEAFESAMNGEPLARSLNTLTRIVKEQLGGDVRTAFYLAYPDGAGLHAIDGAGDMPDTYTGPLDGFPVGDASFCSGYAIATGRPALTRDVLEDPRWEPYLGLASAHNFRSASSYPILTAEGKAVGSFAMYFTGVHEAAPQDFAVAGAVTQAAAIILSRHIEAVERARAEEALRTSEAKYRTLFKSVDEAFCLIEVLPDRPDRAPDYRFLEVNAAFERQTGLTDVVGKLGSEVSPGTEDHWAERYAAVVRTGEAQRFESHHQDTGRWYDASMTRVGGAGSRRVFLVFEDTTERREREERQRFLLALGDAMRAQPSAQAIIEVAARLLAERLNPSRVLFAEFDEPNGVVDVFHAWLADGAEPFPAVVRQEDFSGPILDDLRAGRTLWVDDADDPPFARPDLAALAEVGIKAALSVPLIIGGRLAATLSVHQHAARRWTDSEVALLQEVAQRLWADLVRARAEAALRDSEERLRLTVESVKDYAIVKLDPERRITAWNSGAVQMFGYSEEEAIGESGDIIFTPEDRKAGVPEQEARTAWEQGRADDNRWHLHKDGSRFFVSGVVAPLYEGGHLAGYVKIARDLTEQRQQEREREQLLAELAVLNETLEGRVEERTEALRHSERRFSQAFYVNPIPACMTSFGRETFVEVNDAFLALTGYERDEVLGRASRELAMWSSPEDQKKLGEVQQGGKGFRDVELGLRDKDGGVHTVLMSAEVIRLDGSEGYLKMFYDITEHKQTEARLMGAIQEVMGDAVWFSKRVIEKMTNVRLGE